MTVIPSIFRALGMVFKNQENRLGEQIRERTETIQTTELLRSARIFRSVLES